MGKYLLVVILLWNISCSSSKQGNKESIIVEQDYSKLLDEVVQKKWGKSYAKKENVTKEYVIVLRKTKLFNNLFSDVDFFVFGYKSKSIVLEDHLEQGSVNWVSHNKIIVVSTQNESGVMNKVKYYYNVETNTKKVLD